MPELPEVENLTRQLKSSLTNCVILDTKILFNKLRSIVPADLSAKTKGAKILHLHRRAKYIIIDLSNQYSIIIHLGMTGRINIKQNEHNVLEDGEVSQNRSCSFNFGSWHEIQKHDHIIMTLSNNMTLIYNDPRRFGLIDIINTKDLLKHKLFSHLGIEPLEEEFNASYLFEKLKNKKASIKNTIMDNRVIVGVGNIYASEALFLAHIRPDRIATSLTKKEIELLVLAIKEILQKAINAGGSSIRDFVSIDNKKGGFQKLFSVYAKTNLPCSCCGSYIKKITQSGRSSFFCPSCQK